MVGVLFACLSGLAFGALNVAMRRGLGRRNDVAAASAVISAVALVLTAACALAAGVPAEDFDPRELWPFLLIGVAVPGLSQIATVHAVRGVGASRAGILLGMGPLFSALLAVAAFGEALRVPLVAGTLLVVAGGAVLAWERQRPVGFRRLGAAVALAVAVLFGVRDNVARWAAEDVEIAPLAQSTAALAAAAAVLALNLARQEHRFARVRAAARPFVAAGVFTAVAQVTLFEALDRARVTVVAPLAGTAVLWTVVFAALFIGRSELIGRRLIVVALLVVAGGTLVGATR